MADGDALGNRHRLGNQTKSRYTIVIFRYPLLPFIYYVLILLLRHKEISFQNHLHLSKLRLPAH